MWRHLADEEVKMLINKNRRRQPAKPVVCTRRRRCLRDCVIAPGILHRRARRYNGEICRRRQRRQAPYRATDHSGRHPGPARRLTSSRAMTAAKGRHRHLVTPACSIIALARPTDFTEQHLARPWRRKASAASSKSPETLSIIPKSIEPSSAAKRKCRLALAARTVPGRHDVNAKAVSASTNGVVSAALASA